MPTGSWARTFAPMSKSPVTSEIDGASRMSSVSGLKVRPSTAMVLPRNEPPDRAQDLARHRALAVVVDGHGGLDDPQRHVVIQRDLHQRAGVLGKARSAIAGPGMQEFRGRARLWRIVLSEDTRALVKIALDHDVPLRIVEATVAVNDDRKRAMARKVLGAVGGSLRGKTIAVLGLTFKPDTDDMREAPSIPLVTGLPDMGAKVRAHDPVGMEQARRELPGHRI